MLVSALALDLDDDIRGEVREVAIGRGKVVPLGERFLVDYPVGKRGTEYDAVEGPLAAQLQPHL